MKHLTNKDLSGYIHQTLTDAQRESMNHHLDACPGCRERVDGERTTQRRIHYGLADHLRRERPSNLTFQQIAPQLQKKRRSSRIHFRSMQLLTGVAIASVLFIFATALISFLGVPASWGPLSSSQLPATSSVLEAVWQDDEVYRAGLVPEERQVLDKLGDAPIYHLDLHIDERLNELNGRQEILYINRTGQPLEELYFRLWPNFTTSSLTITNVLIEGKEVQTSPPTEARSTILHVPLDDPLPPNKAITVRMDFDLTVGRSRHSFNGTLGVVDEVLTLAYFHPTLAKIEDGEWQLDNPIHGIANYPENSFYLVEVNAPNSLTVLASGRELSRELLNDRQMVRFAAGPMGPFYLTASEHYTVAATQMVGSTEVTSYILNSYSYNGRLPHYEQAQDALDYAVDALEYMNNHYGTYPYTQLNIIGTTTLNFTQPTTAFPTVVLTDFDEYQPLYDFGQRSLQTAVIYGVTHQWFGRIIGTNRMQYPWLSESIAEFVGQTIVADVYGEYALPDKIEWTTLAERREIAPIGRSIYDYLNRDYLLTMYGRGPDFLSILRDVLGDDEWHQLLQTYYETYKWGEVAPTTAVFQQLAETECECQLNDFFAIWVERPSPE